MSPIGLGLIILGAMLLRQVATGRARDTPGDFREIAVAILHGDFAGVAATLTARGPGVAGEAAPAPVGGSTDAAGSTVVGDYLGGSQGPLETAMRKFGTGKPYVFGAQGPNAYDCSGLVWAACRAVGIYSGPRFLANGSLVTALRGQISEVNDYMRGDIVLWSGHHVGVVSGADRMFSALNSSAGIVDSPISDNLDAFGNPTFWRVSYS